ncbi:CAT RNA binding domain-containing protein [Selenomonas ruminantium]|uniref:CAT RNA binding domain-containing protein n=1 Tax=Selenomonas ruminantium TaxID=971 RepID=UPI000AD561A6
MGIAILFCLFVLSGAGILGEFDVLIKKILNNNVIVTSDEDGCEVVAMGRGIFGRRGVFIRRSLRWPKRP